MSNVSEILANKGAAVLSVDADASVQDEFMAAAKSYQESWSRSNDPFIGLVKGVAETTVGAGERLFGNIFGQRGGGSSSRNGD